MELRISEKEKERERGREGEESYGVEVDFNLPEGIFRLASSVPGYL